MPNLEPKITFLFPYRWLKEDKEFFPANIDRQVRKYIGPDGADMLISVLAYRVTISYQYTKPLKIPLTQTEVQKMLNKLFPNGKCLAVDSKFAQVEPDKNRLPIMDFQIFF